MFENGKRPHITVVGDLILDRYLIGDATKLNPEQPGVVIRVESEEDRLGGAAAVAMISTSLGAFVTVAGAVGRDEPGRRMLDLLDAHDIGTHLWRDDRPTTWKQRIVARGQIRPDRCDREVTTPITDEAADFLANVPLGNALLVSDYGKGVCTDGLLSQLVQRAHDARVPILVDPALSRDWSDCGQMTLIKANWREAIAQPETNELPPLALARELSDRHACHVIITLGARGMVCAQHRGSAWYLPAHSANVRDICGAGDTVFATLAVAIARRKSLRETCRQAMEAAACQVSTVGISPVVEVKSLARHGRWSREQHAG